MKTCQICQTPSEDDAQTCAACGEGSWDDAAEPLQVRVPSEPPPSPDEEATSPDAPRPKRRGAR